MATVSTDFQYIPYIDLLKECGDCIDDFFGVFGCQFEVAWQSQESFGDIVGYWQVESLLGQFYSHWRGVEGNIMKYRSDLLFFEVADQPGACIEVGSRM